MKKDTDFNLDNNKRLADDLDRFIDDNEWGHDVELLLINLSYTLRRTTRHLEFWLKKYNERNGNNG